MENPGLSVIKDFCLNTKTLKKFKGYYILTLDNNKYIMRKSLETAGNILFQHELKEGLNKNGFHRTDRLKESKEGLPYVLRDGEFYVLNREIQGTELDFSDNTQMISAVKSIACFHKSQDNIKYKENPVKAVSLPEKFSRAKKEMEHIKKQISLSRRLSDFDILFLKNYDFHYNRITEAEKVIKNTNYAEKYAKAICNNMICHNLLKKENLLFKTPDTVYIVNFSKAKADYFIQDLADFIYRYIKFQPDKIININRLVDIYSNENPVDEDDIKILYGCLLFPGAFLKASGLYYNKKRTWAPSSVINRMEITLSCKDSFYEYISALE